VLFLIIFILIALLIWGFIGGAQAKDPGITCDMGIGSSLCWQWHKNIIGQTQEFAEDSENAIKDFFK
ncbi:MAG: hypothetical protein ACOCUU_01660, partial [Nanoarchaeota archaeon]